VEFTIAEAKKDNRVTERKTLLVRKKPIENRKASYSVIKTSVYHQQNASKMENIRPNGRNCFSNRHDSERRLENPKKKIKNEEIMKKFRLYFAIFTRQRYEKIQVNSRKIWKSTISGMGTEDSSRITSSPA
jgi:hypothetical protein